MFAQYRTLSSLMGEEVIVVGTPHFLTDWRLERYGKSKSKSLDALLGTPFPISRYNFIYDEMADAPLNKCFYAVLRKRKNLKPFAFIYFRNIKNKVRGGRRELELISVTPPNHAQTEGVNFNTLHFHDETELWCETNYSP